MRTLLVGVADPAQEDALAAVAPPAGLVVEKVAGPIFGIFTFGNTAKKYSIKSHLAKLQRNIQ